MSSTIDPTTGSSAARDAAAATLEYLQQLAADRPGRMIAGVHSPEGGDELHERTGQWPGVLGVEYCYKYGTVPTASAAEAVSWRTLNPPLVKHGQAGGIIRVLSHFPNPVNPGYSGLRDTDANVEAVLTDGTPERGRWLALVDEVAAGFADLAAHGVPVLYGPLHEMNCPGFWWGLNHAHASPEQHCRLYRDIVQRIRHHHGCDNVLWLWAPLGMDPVVLEAYPGDDVVDVVGLDVYGTSLTPFVDAYQAVSGLAKPFVLSEFGPCKWDATEPPKDPPYDCRQLLTELREHWPSTVAFMFWGGVFLPTRQQHADQMMADPSVIDRDHLPFTGRS